jgi:hypothetical protein
MTPKCPSQYDCALQVGVLALQGGVLALQGGVLLEQLVDARGLHLERSHLERQAAVRAPANWSSSSAFFALSAASPT